MSEEKKEPEVPVGAAQMFPCVTFTYHGETIKLEPPDGDDQNTFTHELHQRALRSVFASSQTYKDFRQEGRVDFDIGQVHRDFAGHAFDWQGAIWRLAMNSDDAMGYLFWLLLQHDPKGKKIDLKAARKIYKAQNVRNITPDGVIVVNRLGQEIIDRLLIVPNSEPADLVTMGTA